MLARLLAALPQLSKYRRDEPWNGVAFELNRDLQSATPFLAHQVVVGPAASEQSDGIHLRLAEPRNELVYGKCIDPTVRTGWRYRICAKANWKRALKLSAWAMLGLVIASWTDDPSSKWICPPWLWIKIAADWIMDIIQS